MRVIHLHQFSFSDDRRHDEKPSRWPVPSSFIEVIYGYVALLLYVAAMFWMGADFSTLSPDARKAWLLGALLVLGFTVLTSCAVTRDRRRGGG